MVAVAQQSIILLLQVAQLLQLLQTRFAVAGKADPSDQLNVAQAPSRSLDVRL
jgi:hypothetical protein